MSREELEELYDEIMAEMQDIYWANMHNAPEGVARQKEIIKMINERPEVLRVQTNKWKNDTIGICAKRCELFYVTMRALQDGEACLLKDKFGENVYSRIKISEDFRDRIINSWQYERLIAKQEKSLISKEVPQYDDDDLFSEDDDLFSEDEDENMSEYDSIME